MSLDNFKQWLTLNCEEPTTVNTYYSQMKALFDKVKEPLTQEKLNEYFIFILQNKSKNTFNIVLNSVRKYLEFTKESFELPKQKGIDRRINKYFTLEDLQNDIIPFLQGFYKNHQQAEIVLKLLFLTGIRRKELLTLKRVNIDLVNGKLELSNTKGNVDRVIPIDNITLDQIKQFFNIYPEEHNAFNITVHQLNYLFEKINTELQLKERINARLCRHSSAIHLIRQGLDISYVQNILGHQDIDTTMIYAEPDFKMVNEKYKKIIKGF